MLIRRRRRHGRAVSSLRCSDLSVEEGYDFLQIKTSVQIEAIPPGPFGFFRGRPSASPQVLGEATGPKVTLYGPNGEVWATPTFGAFGAGVILLNAIVARVELFQAFRRSYPEHPDQEHFIGLQTTALAASKPHQQSGGRVNFKGWMELQALLRGEIEGLERNGDQRPSVIKVSNVGYRDSGFLAEDQPKYNKAARWWDSQWGGPVC